MNYMFEAIARVLAFFYSLPVVGGSVGVAIILLTAAVMILLMPLTLKATRSTIKMQEMQPRLKELQKEHKDDKQTLNAELMALYQENGINPVGGCLPMLAQLPVFLVLFNVLRGLSRRVSEAPFYTIAEQARSQVGAAPVVGETFDPRYLDVDSELYVDLSQQTEMTFGPFDLAQEARDVIQDDVVAGIPYVILILFVVATSFYQQRQVSARRTGGVGMNPQQEMILKVLPLASGVWSFLFPAGLVVYWATSNVFRILQQSYITRAFYGRKGDADDGDGDDGGALLSADANDSLDDAVDEVAGASNSGPGKKKSANKAGSKAEPKKNGSGQNGAANKSRKKAAGKKPANASSDATDELSDDGATSNGSEANGAVSETDRAEAWAKRRQRANAKRSNAKEQSSNPSSRVTPKGTKPGSSKKKRKR
ncbi:MAG: membrane protein insertase YidC [Acidimicrobiales bacterium]